MSTRERILTIRLSDKVTEHPMYAKALALEGVQAKVGPSNSIRSETAGLSRKA